MSTLCQIHNGYRLGSTAGLTENQMEMLVRLFSTPAHAAAGDLGGRNQPLITDLTGIGKVVVKQYFRGGVIRHINRQTYFDLKKTRGRKEFELLARLRELGVNVPEPVAFAAKGCIIYRGWLVTKAIPASLTLIDICRTAPERAEAAMPMVTGQIMRLIANGILHVDLHPGNVLVDDNNRVFLIDFDKARTGMKNPKRTRDRYLRRWGRAVNKYAMPGFMNQIMIADLTNLKL